MSFIVRFMKSGSPLFTFETPTPFVVPDHTPEFNDQLVPRLVAIVKTWTLDGIFFGNESTVSGKYDDLVAAIENPANYPDGVQIVRGTNPSGTVIADLSTSNGWRLFKIEKLSVHKSPLIFRGELRFTIRISAKKFLQAAELVTNISDLKLTESWYYGEAGLLVHTLRGELEVSSGSAIAAARQLVPLIFTLPGATFAFSTAGPEGANVEKLSRSDTKARFTSTMRESGSALPAGVGPSFTKAVRTVRVNGETTSTVTVSAIGPGAEAAVVGAKPSGATLEDLTVDDWTRTARAIYTTTAKEGKLLRIHEFSTRGGGKGIAFSKRTGDRDPAQHTLARGPCEIVESIRVEVTGAPSMDDFLLPEPVSGLDEDTDAASYVMPHRTVIGRDRSGDQWVMSARRVYRAPSRVQVPTVLGEAIFRPQQNVRPAQEFNNKAGPAGRGGGELLFGGGLSGPLGLF